MIVIRYDGMSNRLRAQSPTPTASKRPRSCYSIGFWSQLVMFTTEKKLYPADMGWLKQLNFPLARRETRNADILAFFWLFGLFLRAVSEMPATP